MKKRVNRLCSLLCVLALLLGLLPTAASAAEGPNLVPDTSEWAFTNGGISGDHFYLDENGFLSIEIVIPASSTYAVSGLMATDGSTVDCSFGVRYRDGAEIQSQVLESGLDYAFTNLGTHALNEGDTIELYVTRGPEGSWVNGNGLRVVDTNYVNSEPEQELEPEADYSGNLLANPSFEDGGEGWFFQNGAGDADPSPSSSGAGLQGNNPHTGKKGFFLDARSDYVVYQEIEAPYNGWYLASAWIATGGAGSGLGIENITAGTEERMELPNGSTYRAAHTLPAIKARQGDTLRIYSSGGKGWTNGDDFFLAYDFSQVTLDLLEGVDLTGGTALRLPWAGDYQFEASVTGDGVTVGGQTVSGNTSLTLEALELDTMLTIVVPQGCAVTGASLTFDTSGIPNEAPTASNAVIVGAPLHTGITLTGSYDFADSDDGQGGSEGGSTFRWLQADEAAGAYDPIPNATGKAFELTDAQDGKYIRFEVTPVDGLGLAGDAVSSAPVGPVTINYVRNPSLDIENSSKSPEGWSSKNGGAMPNSSSAARNGFRFARIPAERSDAEVSYAVDISRTAFYEAGVWVKNPAGGGVFGVRNHATGAVIGSVELAANKAYTFISVADLPLEKGAKIEVFLTGSADCGQIDADDFQLVRQEGGELPPFVTLHSFRVAEQIRQTIDAENKTITFHVLHGTDVTALEVTAAVSEGASISPASGTAVDFSSPVEFTITNGDVSQVWTVDCIVDEERLALRSDNQVLAEGFNWAVDKTDQFVMTGTKNGPINVPQSSGQTADYIPSYWAGYYDRTAFYSRDFVHQAVGAQIVGLWNENYSMFHTFADFADEAHKWYTGWAFNFDGSIYTMDYKGNDNFVREVPAQFELVEKAYQQYLWSGDERYIRDETMWNFYTKVMTDFITLHDTNGNGVAEGTGKGIFQGSCTYNERGGQPIIEAGDAIGAQYQATLAYAAMLEARGEHDASKAWYQKAADLKTYFDEVWSVSPDDPDGPYARALSTDGETRYNDFGKENSWFMPMKQITTPGPRTDAYLNFIADEVGDHIGDKPNSPSNIEAWTYLPDVFFPYNRANDAWKYMKYILSVKDDPHERPIQGTNGDYPELSYTTLSSTIAGMMGVEPDAAAHKIATAPRLPDEIGYVEADHIEIGGHIVDLRHDGLTKSTLTNRQGAPAPLTWEIRFYGKYQDILVDGVSIRAAQKDINGVTVSYVTATVPAGDTVTAQAGRPGEPVELFSVTIAPMDNGVVAADKAGAGAGETVTLTVTPADGYVLTAGSLKVNGSAEGVTAAAENIFTFVMPAEDVTVSAVFESAYVPPIYSGGSNTTTETVKNGDGSTTRIVTNKATGTVTETTTYPNGDKTAVETKKDGTVTETVTRKDGFRSETVTKPDGSFTSKATDENGVKTETTGTSEGEITASVALPGNVEQARVLVPVPEVTSGTVAVLVHEDGSETVLKTSVAIGDGVSFLATGDIKVKIVDNSKAFADVAEGHWAYDAIQFAASRELFTGTGAGSFSPAGDMTRSMLVTVLARLDGQETSGGAAWYSKAMDWGMEAGITDGANMDASVTRESLVVMLCRYAKAETTEAEALNDFPDADKVSDWAEDAMSWAVANGILTGNGAGELNPAGNASRAEVAAILMRFVAQMAK